MHIVTVGRTEATSNELKIPEPTCGGNACATGYCADDKCVAVPRPAAAAACFGWML